MPHGNWTQYGAYGLKARPIQHEDSLTLLLVTTLWSDYPLEGPLLVLVFLNPVDLARVLLLLSFDISALMGYTGAVYERFFHGLVGMVLALAMLLVCAGVPFLLGLRWFRRKDF